MRISEVVCNGVRWFVISVDYDYGWEFFDTMNKYKPVEGDNSSFNIGDTSNLTSGWTEIDLSEVMKRPCFAYKRGNIVFTTMPPSRDEKRARSATLTAGANDKCRVNIVDVENNSSSLQKKTDLCEVCCGFRSPSFSRRAHSFTTHFCTRVPAKTNVSTLSPFAQEAKNTSNSLSDSTSITSSFANSCRNPAKVGRLSILGVRVIFLVIHVSQIFWTNNAPFARITRISTRRCRNYITRVRVVIIFSV